LTLYASGEGVMTDGFISCNLLPLPMPEAGALPKDDGIL